jgi:hypothetical protein
MRANLAALSLSLLAGATVCSAQSQYAPQATAPSAKQADVSYVYCAGFVSDAKLPTDIRIISGEQSDYKITYARGDNVFLNRGEDKGVKIGDRYTIARPDTDIANEWFYGQVKLLKAMGTLYRDAGVVRVVSVQPKTSVAEVVFSCDYIERGDIARPFEERPTPPFKDPGAFDHFAPVSGKPVGTVITAFDYHQLLGRGDTLYVNVGAQKGVKVGDYMRVFRHQGTTTQYAQEKIKGYQNEIYGFGSSPTKYKWEDLPREVLGEGIVLNVTRNAATVLLTYNTTEIYTGDYVEVE